MNKDFVSYIIPSYEGELHIANTIDSILAQDYPKKEIIIIVQDPKGLGNYDKIYSTYSKFCFIQFHFFHKKMKPSAARNIGINLASGGFICVVDDDDLLLDQDLTSCAVNFLSLHSQFGVVSHFSDMLIDGKIFPYRYKYCQALDKFHFTHSGTIFRKNVLQEIGVYNENYKLYEDLDLFLRIMEIYLVHLSAKKVLKRFDQKSISQTSSHFEEFHSWLRVTLPFRKKYPGFYWGFFKKAAKCLFPANLIKMFY